MSVYVDEPTDYGARVKGAARRYGTVWSHMMADTEDELIAMAKVIGLSERHIQHRGMATAHFDIIPTKRLLAIKHGAQEMATREIIRMRRQADGD